MRLVESSIFYALPKSRLEEVGSRFHFYELLVGFEQENTKADFATLKSKFQGSKVLTESLCSSSTTVQYIFFYILNIAATADNAPGRCFYTLFEVHCTFLRKMSILNETKNEYFAENEYFKDFVGVQKIEYSIEFKIFPLSFQLA